MRSKVGGLEHTVELKESHIRENEELLASLNGDLRHSQSELSASRIKCSELTAQLEELKDKLTETTHSVRHNTHTNTPSTLHSTFALKSEHTRLYNCMPLPPVLRVNFTSIPINPIVFMKFERISIYHNTNMFAHHTQNCQSNVRLQHKIEVFARWWQQKEAKKELEYHPL